MGLFSWKTSDTKRSIPSILSTREPVEVYMVDDKGTLFFEDSYEGYGVFGGKDYYELLAQMNGKNTREQGIDLAYSGKTILRPKLVENPEIPYEDLEDSSECPNQGFFYYEDED